MNRNVDFSSPKAKEKKEKQDYIEAYIARQILLAGKFTFPTIDPLPSQNDANGNPLDPTQIPIIEMKDVTFSYNVEKGLPFIFKDPTSLSITASTRLGVMGPNGAGKSTLLQLLTNRIKPVTGTVTTNQDAKIAYFAQHHIQELNLEQTPSEYMAKQFPDVDKSALLRKHLEKVGVTGTIQDTRMISLSSGMRSCVIFAKITYRCPHLLIMDEPTNFLDLDSLDSLIAATNKFTGSLLLVSHNRRFLLKCAKQYLSVVPGQFNLYSDLKACEKATYAFIEELEAGGKVGGAALEKKAPTGAAANTGGGIVISSKPVAKAGTPAAKAGTTPAAKAGTTPAAKAGTAPAAKAAAATAKVATDVPATRAESKSVSDKEAATDKVSEGHHQRSQSQFTARGGGSVRGRGGGHARGGSTQHAPRQPQQNQKHINNAPTPRPIQQPQSRSAPAPRQSSAQ
jgi:ABC-type Mn2+/Zn2+ transport system ATPase subunit